MGLTVGQFAPVGGLYVPYQAGSSTTPFSVIIPPMLGPVGSPPRLLQPGLTPNTLGQNNIAFSDLYISHVTKVCITMGGTAQLCQILRPVNYTWVTAAVAANATSLILYDSPGTFSTNYKYGLPTGAVVASTADVVLGSSHWVVVQLLDGTFFVSKVTSWTSATKTLVIATNIPNVTGGGMLVGAPVWMYVVGTSQVDPANGQIFPTKNIVASSVDDVTWADPVYGIAEALHPGDPLLFYSPGTGAAATLQFITGYHTKL